MEYVWIAVMAAVTFGVCFLLDKLFARLFRSRRQHKSGRQVRLRKRVATFGLLILLLGVSCVVFYWNSHPVIFWSGWVLLAVGGFLVYYYLSFGVFYDGQGFLYSRFGKQSRLYTYGEICSQQLYNSQGSVLVELQLACGDTVPVQDSMDGWDGFLDFAYERWLQAKGLKPEDCPFHDPAACCWFPAREV